MNLSNLSNLKLLEGARVGKFAQNVTNGRHIFFGGGVRDLGCDILVTFFFWGGG